MRGRHSALVVTLTPADRVTLTAWERSTTMPHGLARRGRMVLLRAAGYSITTIARRAGVSRRNVYRWLRRYQGGGIAALARKPYVLRKKEPTHAG